MFPRTAKCQEKTSPTYEPLYLSHCKQKAQIAFSVEEIDRINAENFIFFLPLEIMRVYLLSQLYDNEYVHFSSTSF